MKKILIFGRGYVGQKLVDALDGEYEVTGTAREADVGVICWNAGESNPEIEQKIMQVDAILCSIPPHEMGDVAFAQFGEVIQKSNVKWIGYLSTTGVYGDHQGGKVDENTPLNAQNARAKKRVLAEEQWASLINTERSVCIFRLPGVYGVGRSAFDALKAGRAKRIDMRLKNGDRHFFCRAHVDDIVQVIKASLEKQILGVNVYNIVDDMPAPQVDVVDFAAKIMAVPVPKLMTEQQADMSDMAKSFYAECKFMQNDKIKTELGVVLKYPTYKHGLEAIWRAVNN